MAISVLVQAGHEGGVRNGGIATLGTSNATFGWNERDWTPIVADAAAIWLVEHGISVYRDDAWLDADNAIPGDQKYSADYAVFIHFDGSGTASVTQASVGYSLDGRGGTNDVHLANTWETYYTSKGWSFGWHPDNFTTDLAGYYGYSYAINTKSELVLELGTITNTAAAAWLNDHLSQVGQWIGETIYIDNYGSLPPVDQTNKVSLASAVTALHAENSDEVVARFLNSELSGSVTNVHYTGSDNAAFLIGDFSVPGAFSLHGGLYLSSGGFPGSSNTSGSFSIVNNMLGDASLSATAASAFSGAGATHDASVIQFTFDNHNPDVSGINFQLVFGSDEYPEFSNTSFVDVAGVYVNGVNYALFNQNASTPLSVIQANVNSGNFINNTSGAYPVEWDGFSHVLSIRAPLQLGENTIKIGVADTGDFVLDSGLYIADLKLLTEGGLGGGVLNVVNGSTGNNNIQASSLAEEINLFGGQDTVAGTPSQLNGDVITSFGEDDVLLFQGASFSAKDMTVTLGSAILDIDTNQDGIKDTNVTLTGNFQSAEFHALSVNGNTQVTVELPSPNHPPISVDDTAIATTGIGGTATSDAAHGVLVNDSDADGDTVTVTDFSGGSHGSLVLNPDGSYNYTVADLTGLTGSHLHDVFTYAISDGHGGVASAYLDITLNRAPLAANDSAGVIKGATISGNVLANDSDADSDTVQLTNVAGGSLGDHIVGKYGALTLKNDGSYSYVASQGALPSGIVAQDTFSYAVADGHGGTGAATLSVVVLNPSQSYQAGSNTTLNGGNGPDVLDGTAGHDTLLGGNGPDVLIGGPGDTLTGGNGPDIFLFGQHFGLNAITDFDVNTDAIQVSKALFTSVTDLLNHTADSASGAVIAASATDQITLVGITKDQLVVHSGDFYLL